MSPTALAVLSGLGLGVGLWTLVSMVPGLNHPRFLYRVAPYVADVSEGARTLLARHPSGPTPVLGALLGPWVTAVRDALSSVLGGTTILESRLLQARSPLTVQAFRSRQLVWAVAGAAVGVAVAVLIASIRSLPVIAGALVVMVFAGAGIAGCDYLLRRAAAYRVRQITEELPTTLQFLTLSLSAGEGVLDAIRRVATVGHGQLALEFAEVVADVGIGVPFADSLAAMSSRLQLPAVARCVEQVSTALERGTPLADVLRAQAQDAREEAKRRLIEVAGRKEVAMMVPLVFLILPVTIVFAIFPGIFVLQLGV